MPHKLKCDTKDVFFVEFQRESYEPLCKAIKAEPDLAICARVCYPEVALLAIQRLKPAVVIITGFSLQGRRDPAFIRKIRKQNPEIKIVVICMLDETHVGKALIAGADGCCANLDEPEEIIWAIRNVLNGHIYVSEDSSRSPASQILVCVRKQRNDHREVSEVSDSSITPDWLRALAVTA